MSIDKSRGVCERNFCSTLSSEVKLASSKQFADNSSADKFVKCVEYYGLLHCLSEYLSPRRRSIYQKIDDALDALRRNIKTIG